jgi:MraZ protein
LKALVGTYDLTIDEKNRLLIPAELRRALDPSVDGEAFYMVIGKNEKPWLWAEKQYEAHAQGRGSEFSPSDDELAFDHLMSALTVRLEWDKQGRVLIPERSMKDTKELQLGREVTLVGARDHLEIWSRQAWVIYRQDLERRRAEITARAKQKQLPVNS